jgi:hypothetical protein
MKSLKSLDRRLDCTYSYDLERFVVTYDRGYGDPLPMMLIETEGKRFRRPRQSDVEFLQRWDMENMRLSDRLNMVTKYMADYQAKKRRDSKDEFRNRTKDDKIQLMNAFGKAMGSGKHNSAFRRIIPKPKGSAYNVVDKRFHSAQATATV